MGDRDMVEDTCGAGQLGSKVEEVETHQGEAQHRPGVSMEGPGVLSSEGEDEEGGSSTVDKQGKKLPFWRTTKNSELPPEFWDERRQLRNRNRRVRNKANKRERNEALRKQEEAQLESLTEEEIAARKEAAYQQRIKAHLDQKQLVSDGLKSGLRVVVECSFIEQFSEREVRSMAKQLEYSVVVNKRSEKPMALTFCSWRGDIAAFCGKMGGESWPVNRMEENVMEAFPTEQLIVLSPDGGETLSELDPSKVYCIGGIVDRTTKKNVTKNWAEEHKIPAVRLPIDEFCPVPGNSKGHGKRHVLNINDVVTALAEFHVSGDWKCALEAALPERKKRADLGATHKHKRRKAKAVAGPAPGSAATTTLTVSHTLAADSVH